MGVGSAPIHTICRHWLAKGISFGAVKAVIEQLIGRQVSLTTKDNQGDKPTLIMIKTWLGHNGIVFDDLFPLLNYFLMSNAGVNALDTSGKTLLHYVFELWGNKLEPKRLWDFVVLMNSHQANFNIKDNQGRTPLFYLFTHWQYANNTDIFMPMLQSFVGFGAVINVEDGDGISIVHLAAMHSTAAVFYYLLYKFETVARIGHWSSLRSGKQALFACISLNQESEAMLVSLCSQLVAINAPLDIDTPAGQGLWANLQQLDNIMNFVNLIRLNGKPEQAMHLARHYETGHLLENPDLLKAFQFYALALEMQVKGGEVDAFISSCQVCGLNGIERLSAQLDVAKAYLIEYFVREQRLDLAEQCYNSLLNPSYPLTCRLGQLCFDLGDSEMAIHRYGYVPAILQRACSAMTEQRFEDGVTDYCSTLQLSKPDPQLHRQVGECLIKISNKLVAGKLCSTIIVRRMLAMIRTDDFDRELIKKILSAYDHIGRLFSEVACVAPKSASMTSYMPTFIMPLVRKVERKVESVNRFYSTATAEAYLEIMSGDDVEFETFKQRYLDGQTSPAVKALIAAVTGKAVSLPHYLVDDKFMARISQLLTMRSEPVAQIGQNSNN
jgi:hypothetical protein